MGICLFKNMLSHFHIFYNVMKSWMHLRAASDWSSYTTIEA